MHIYYYITSDYIMIQSRIIFQILLEHLINVVIFYDTMMSQNWITNKNKDVCIQLDTQMYQLLRAASDYSIFDEEMMLKFLHSVLISQITWLNSIIYSYFRYWVINCRHRYQHHLMVSTAFTSKLIIKSLHNFLISQIISLYVTNP